MLNCKVPQKSTNKLGAKMGSRFATCAATIFGALLLQPAPIQAQTVSYGVTAVGGNVWQYDYTITNTSPTLIFDQVTIYFDYSSYSFIDTATAPAGWDPLVIQRDLGIPADGFYDVLKLAGPMAFGESVSGFSVRFTYLDPGAPGSQAVDFLNSSDFSLVHSGYTVQLTPIPEPAAVLMLALGLPLVAGVAIRRRRQDAMAAKAANGAPSLAPQ